jgi:hypothetical protein
MDHLGDTQMSAQYLSLLNTIEEGSAMEEM